MNTIESMVYLTDQANLCNVRYLAEPVLSNPDFELWSGSPRPELHHYGKGMLAVHTAEVLQISLTVNEIRNLGIPKDRLYLSCLYHDFGKLWDYKPITNILKITPEDHDSIFEFEETTDYNQWTSTEHKYKVYHIQRSALEWNKVANKNKLDQDFTDDILHAILAHHGMPEWGSPVRPQTKMAWLVHTADNMSARVFDCGVDSTRRK